MTLSNIQQRIPKRYVLSFLGFIGLFNAFILRANLSIAIVGMVTPMYETTPNNISRIIPAIHNWNTRTQGYILSSFFYTYCLFQVPAGFLATKYGGRILFGGSIGLCAFLTLFTPICAQAGSGALIFLRLLEGLVSTCVYPALHDIWSKWAPKSDKSTLATFAFSGAYVGTFITLMFGGVIAADWAWEWLFYLSGLFSLVWTVIWFYFTAELPSTHETISEEEAKYIEEHRDQAISQIDTIPWKDIFTSLPVWAIIAVHFGTNWSLFLVFNEFPTFLVKSLGFHVDSAGSISALPWLLLSVTVYAAGIISDKLTEKYSTLFVRKFIVSLTFIVLILAFVLVTLLNVKSRALIVTGIIIVVSACGPAWASFGVNHLDIGGHYAGVLMGISNSIGSTPGFLTPIITGYVVDDSYSKREWDILFVISMVIGALALVFYIVFADGELQPWVLGGSDEYEPVFNNPISSPNVNESSVLNENNTE
ncbi:unnamed protein product [Rotaria socialis]